MAARPFHLNPHILAGAEEHIAGARVRHQHWVLIVVLALLALFLIGVGITSGIW